LALLIGLQLAVEAAALQLGGIEALGRGSPKAAFARHLALAAGVFVVLVATLWASLSAVFGGHGTVAVAVGLLVVLAASTALF
jgi:hypothetical protein